jgi:hypothetical protein
MCSPCVVPLIASSVTILLVLKSLSAHWGATASLQGHCSDWWCACLAGEYISFHVTNLTIRYLVVPGTWHLYQVGYMKNRKIEKKDMQVGYMK